MRLEDRRPAFAGLANLTEQQLQSLPTPCYLLDEAQLRRNGQIMLELQQRTGCRALLAQKAFSNFDVYPVLAPYLAGTEASGLYESRLGREQLPEKENHVFCAAYRADEFAELLQYADHIVFNSPGQLAQFGPAAKAAGKSVGLRVNPQCSTQEGHAIYDPCAPGSRLGTTRAQWDAAVAAHPELPELLDGLHFHTLCEQDADALAVTLKAVEATFGDLLPKMKWVNFGGGHHVTRPGYDLATLEQCICQVQQTYGVQVYLEPGEAWALNAGYLITTVLDTLQNGDTRLAILDTSAACHTPDVIEMPAPAGRRRPRRKALHRAAGGPHLPGRGCDGRLQLQRPLGPGPAAGVWRYGHLHHLQKQHLQRHAVAGYLALAAGWQPGPAGPLWLPGFPLPSGGPGRRCFGHNICPNLSALSLPEKQPRSPGRWQEIPNGKVSLRSLV